MLVVLIITNAIFQAVDANEVFFDGYEIPADTLVGEEGQGFRIILHGMNAERCLLAGEALGIGYAALEKAAAYANDRSVFGRPIGKNQAIAFPLADAFMQLEAAKALYISRSSALRQERQEIALSRQMLSGWQPIAPNI